MILQVQGPQQRAITCRVRGAYGSLCLRTAESVDRPFVAKSYENRGGEIVSFMRQLYRCTKAKPHEFCCEWPEISPAHPGASPSTLPGRHQE